MPTDPSREKCMETLDIYSESAHSVAKRLSNFTPRKFIFDGVSCESIEVVLQAFKISDQTMNAIMCAKTAQSAHLQKSVLDKHWQKSQMLYWAGERFARNSAAYHELVTRLYDVVYEQDVSFREDLVQAVPYRLTHKVGKFDCTKTVLTVPEFLGQLCRLQVRVLSGA